MNSLGILKHEIKRLIVNKKYLYMLLVVALMSYDIISRLVSAGLYGTAPFSQWSYSSYLCLVTPIIMMCLILLLANTFSKKELKIREIIYSTPITQTQYYTIKAIATFTATLLALLVSVLVSFIYYGSMYKFYSFIGLLKPIILFFIPASLFCLGIFMLIGKISVKILYALIPFTFIFGTLNLSLPVWSDIFGNNFLYLYQFVVWRSDFKGVVPYTMPADFLLSRFILIGIGVVGFLIVCFRKELK